MFAQRIMTNLDAFFPTSTTQILSWRLPAESWVCLLVPRRDFVVTIGRQTNEVLRTLDHRRGKPLGIGCGFLHDVVNLRPGTTTPPADVASQLAQAFRLVEIGFDRAEEIIQITDGFQRGHEGEQPLVGAATERTSQPYCRALGQIVPCAYELGSCFGRSGGSSRGGPPLCPIPARAGRLNRRVFPDEVLTPDPAPEGPPSRQRPETWPEPLG